MVGTDPEISNKKILGAADEKMQEWSQYICWLHFVASGPMLGSPWLSQGVPTKL